MTERTEHALAKEFTANVEQARTPDIDMERLEEVKKDIMRERLKQGRVKDTEPM